ncbi:hypothetical protein F4809DRAFT_637380 [Biscogniauxia mediterranea]|nr:hypothetical protein F4809DRAFT_637380 [Biscogniauxia mediterranea]
MSQSIPHNVITLAGTLIIFGCGHKFVQDNKEIPTLNKNLQDNLRCPTCFSRECLACGGVFSGYLYVCPSCEAFGAFECWADDAVEQGYEKMRFQQGVIMVPWFNEEPTKISSWTEHLSVAIGDVHLQEDRDTTGQRIASKNMKLCLSEIRELQVEGQVGITRLPEPREIDVHIEDGDTIPQGQKQYSFIPLL